MDERALAFFIAKTTNISKTIDLYVVSNMSLHLQDQTAP
jgi:hypothetical protein